MESFGNNYKCFLTHWVLGFVPRVFVRYAFSHMYNHGRPRIDNSTFDDHLTIHVHDLLHPSRVSRATFVMPSNGHGYHNINVQDESV